VKFLCDQCKAKYQIADEKAAGKTVRMKCRKCGHLIEVRAGVAEGSASSPPPAPPAAPRAPQRPPPPRAAPLASNHSSARSPARPPDRSGGALASAFRSNVQRDDEVSAPVDMSDLSAGDEWYVAINGVPVGPIRIAEVRRKAAIGAVTEESLCWQEGLDEWRALRSFPELAVIVREAFASGRSSLTPPPPEGRVSAVPPPGRTSVRPPAPTGITSRAPTPRPPPAPAARSNVVPITSRLATAERLADAPDALTRPQTGPAVSPFGPGPSVVPDPFAPPQPRGGAAMAPPMAMAPAPAAFVSATPSFPSGLGVAGLPAKKAPPWMAIAMVAAAAAFGVTAAIAIFLRPPAAPAPVVVQVPGPPATVAALPPLTVPSSTTATPTDTTPSPPSAATRGPIAMAAAPRSSATTGAAPTARGLDLHALSPGSNVLPTDDPGGGDAPRPTAGQGVTSAQVSQVVGLHQVALRRTCWERNPSQKTAVNVSVTFTVAGDGSVQGASASGDEPSIAQCIANDVRGWHFPATGVSQPVNVPFHFVKQ